MKAIFYNSFIEKIKQPNNIEIKDFSIGDTTEKYKLYSIWKPEENLLSLSILFNNNDENRPDLSEVTKICVYYAIFDQESNEENIAFILQGENNSNHLGLNSERNIINVRFENDIIVKSKFELNIPELNSDGEFLEGSGVNVGENLFRTDIKDTEIVSKDSYYKLVKSNLTSSKVKGPDSSTGLDSEGKNIKTIKYRKIYKEDSFVLGVFDETNYINISDEIKTKYNLPREIGYDSILSNESNRGAYKSLKLTGSVDYDLYYVSDSGLEYINTGSDEITGIDGVRIVNVETGYGFTYEIDNLLYNVNYFTPEGVDTDDPLINPYGIFVLELTYVNLNGEVETIRSNKLRLIQGGYYGYFNVISRDSNYFYPKDDSAMYLFGRRRGEKKNFTIRVKSPIFTEYWETGDISKIKSDISFEFENDYMEQELKKLFNFSFTIDKIEDLEDVFDIEVEILTLKNNDDPDHWLPYCDPDGDGVDESTLSLIKLNVDLDTTVNMYFERFYCAQGNQANNIVLSNVNATTYDRSLINSKDGLVYQNDEVTKTISITEEYDDKEDIELGIVPFYWKVITKPEELTITPITETLTDQAEILKGEGEFNEYVVNAFKTGDKSSILRNRFNLDFDYNKFLGTYELPEYLTLIKLTQEEYIEDIDVPDTWETFLTYNILKLPIKKEGVRPYIKIDGSVLNSRGNEAVLSLNTNPIRVEKVKVSYNATLQARIVSEEAIDDGRYKFWDGENEVDTITLTNLSGEEETDYLYIVIKEVGRYSKNYTGAKIIFEYTPQATVRSPFVVNSEDNLTTYIKLTEGALEDSTYSIKFSEFKFNEEPGLGKGIGFAQRVLAGYKNDAGDWVEPDYSTLNYINNTPNQSISTICDVFVPFFKVGSDESQEFVPAFEARFKSSISYELDVRQNISSFDLETGSVFGVNEDGDYEFKYHFIKFTNKELFRNTLANYPAASYDINLTIRPYNYNSNTFRAVDFRLWSQRLSNELIVSSNSQLKGLARFGNSDNVESTVIYEKNNINEATAYIPSEETGTDYKLAWVGYEVENGAVVDANEDTISHSLVQKYAGETKNLYITKQVSYGNKVLQLLSTIDVENPSSNLSDYLKAVADIGEWENGSIILKKKDLSTLSVSDYLAGYVVNLPNNVKDKLELPTPIPVVVSYNKYGILTSQEGTEISKQYDFNWYNETGFSGDDVITGERGNPGGDLFVYAFPQSQQASNIHDNVIQIRTTDKFDEDLKTTTDSFVKVRENMDFYLKRVRAENIVNRRDTGLRVYTTMDDGTLRDITNEIDWNSSVGGESPILCWSTNIPDTLKNWINVKFWYNGIEVTGDDELILDTKEFTFIDAGNHRYEFSIAEYEKTVGYFRYPTYDWKQNISYPVPEENSQTGNVFTVRSYRSVDVPGEYWIETSTGIAYSTDGLPDHDFPYISSEGGGSGETVTGVNQISNSSSYYVRPVTSSSTRILDYDTTNKVTLGGTVLVKEKYLSKRIGSTFTRYVSDSADQNYMTEATVYFKDASTTVGANIELDRNYYTVDPSWNISVFKQYLNIKGTEATEFSSINSTIDDNWHWHPAFSRLLTNSFESNPIEWGDEKQTVRFSVHNSVVVSGTYVPVFDGDIYIARVPRSAVNWDRRGGSYFSLDLPTVRDYNFFGYNNLIPLIVFLRQNLEEHNQEVITIGFVLLTTTNVYPTKGTIPTEDYQSVYHETSSTPRSGSFEFILESNSMGNPTIGLYKGADYMGKFLQNSVSDALFTTNNTTSFVPTGITYSYPYFDGNEIVIKASSEKNTTINMVGTLPNNSLNYIKTTNKWYPCVFYNEGKLSYNAEDATNYFMIKATDDANYGFYPYQFTNAGNKYYFKTTRSINDCYLDFYKTNTGSRTIYIAEQMSENPNIQITPDGCQQTIIPERKVYSYSDYEESRYSVYQYFDWFNEFFFEKDSSELETSPYLFRVEGHLLKDPTTTEDTMLDGISTVQEVVNMTDSSNIASLKSVQSGYRYALYTSDGQYINYYSLNPYDIDFNEGIFFSDPICTEIITNNTEVDEGKKHSLVSKFGVFKVNNGYVHAINSVDEGEFVQSLNTNYIEYGMGFPRKKGKGSKYIIENRVHSPENTNTNFAYLYEVNGGSESDSSTKISLNLVEFIKLIPPDNNESSIVDLTQFYYNGYYYQLGTSNYYIYSGSSANISTSSEDSPYKGDRLQLPSSVYGWQSDSTIEDKYFDIWIDNDPDNPNPQLVHDPLIGLVFSYDNINLGDRPKTGLMYPISSGMGEDYQPIYHIDRTELGRTDSHYIDYAVVTEPRIGITTKLYTVDYDEYDETRKRKNNWDIKPVDTGKTVSFGSVNNMPNKELKLFKYKYTTDSETRIFLPLPDRLRQDEIITENFIGNPEKELSVVIKNPTLKVSVPDYTFPANGGVQNKELSITRGYLIDSMLSVLPQNWSCTLGDVNGEPDPNYWSSYVGFEEKYLEFAVPDRYQEHQVGNDFSDINKLIVNFGQQQSNYTTFNSIEGQTSTPTYKITQSPVFFGIRLKLSTSEGVLIPYQNWIETTTIGPFEISDTVEEILADVSSIIYQTHETDRNSISIEAIEDPHKIVSSIDTTGIVKTIHINRNKTRVDRKCTIKFTNTSDSNTTALIVEIIQKSTIPTLELYYDYESGQNPINGDVYFGADGILKNPTDESGKSDGVLYIRTNLLNDVVDSSLITLKQRKELIYKLLRLTMSSGDPIFYEISVINSSVGDLYYTGDGYDDVYRVYKLINISKLPNIDVRNISNIGIIESSFTATCEVREDVNNDSSAVLASKTVNYSCVYGTFSISFTKCMAITSGGSYIVRIPYGIREEEGSVVYNENVTSLIRPEDYSNSKYKTERNPDIYYLLEDNQTQPFMQIAHGNELSGGWEPSPESTTFEHIPLNYLKVIRYEGSLVGNNWNIVETVLDDLIITNTVDIRRINSQEDYSSVLQGVLSDVSYENSPDTIVIGTGNSTITFNIRPEDEGYIKLLKYRTVNSGDYSIRNTITLEYRDGTLRYPLKCRLFVYFDLVD